MIFFAVSIIILDNKKWHCKNKSFCQKKRCLFDHFESLNSILIIFITWKELIINIHIFAIYFNYYFKILLLLCIIIFTIFFTNVIFLFYILVFFSLY